MNGEGVEGESFGKRVGHWLQDLGTQALNSPRAKLLAEKGMKWLGSQDFQGMLQRVGNTEFGRTVTSKLIGLASDKLAGPVVQRMFEHGLETIIGGATSVGSSDNSQKLLQQLLGNLESDDFLALFNTPGAEAIISALSGFGSQFALQTLDAMTDGTYARWILDNKPPTHPSQDGIAQQELILTKDWEQATHFACSRCGNTFDSLKERSCPSCLSTEVSAYALGPNSKWTERMRAINLWQQKEEEVRAALRKGQLSERTGAAAGIAAVGIAPRLGAEIEGMLTGAAGGSKVEEAVATKGDIGKQILSGTYGYEIQFKGEIVRARADVPSEDEITTQLARVSSGSLRLNKLDVMKTSGVVDSVSAADMSTIQGTVICLGDFFHSGTGQVKVSGTLIVLGTFKGRRVPETTLSGKVYCVTNQTGELITKSQISNTAGVSACTLGKVYDIAKDLKLI